MIKEFTHGDTLFTVDEVSSIESMPKSLVEYIETNRASLEGLDLLYTHRATYPYYDATTLTGRKRFRPASITVSTQLFDFSKNVKTNTGVLVYEDVEEEVKVFEAVHCNRIIGLDGAIIHHVEMPASQKQWWQSLPNNTTIGYEWTGTYFSEIFKFDVNRVTFTTYPVDVTMYDYGDGRHAPLSMSGIQKPSTFMKW